AHTSSAADGTAPPPPIQQSCAGPPAGRGAVLAGLRAKTPAARFATPAEVAAALRPFTAGCDLGRLLETAEDGLEAARPRAADAMTPPPGAWETAAGRGRHAPSAGRGRTRLVAVAARRPAAARAAALAPRA